MRLVIIVRLLLSLVLALKSSYYSLDDETKEQIPTEIKAWCVEMDVETFRFFSSVVEAESNRGPGLEGRTLIALTILNRVDSSNWPNTIEEVIKQSGQFQVYYEGTYKVVGGSDLSDLAIMEAVKWAEEEHPNVIYFNSIGYFPGHTPYKYVDGNYFSLGG